MKRPAILSVLVLALSPFAYSQDPLPILRSSWDNVVIKADKTPVPDGGPARSITVDDTVIERSNRSIRADHPEDPTTMTPDGRRAQIERNEQEAKTVQPTDVKGFSYSATVRNDSSKTVKIIYWEFRFTEIANPQNVVRHQFLCSVDLKKGAQIDLSAFTTLAPVASVSADTLRSASEKSFDEKAQINRIEYADDEVLQRGNWKLSDVKSAVERATSTPWGKEKCRPL